ncbi:TPA: hypothetical protein ACGUTL_004359 [Vibrio vulnificus]
MSQKLYLIQNDTHLKNFSFLMEEGDYYINLGRITGQADFCNINLKGEEITIDISNADFYSLGSISRILYVFKFTKSVKRALNGILFSSVVIGNDGSLQKAIINSLSRRVPVYMWLDGLVSSLDNKANLIKLSVMRCAEIFNIDHYFPSVIGTSSSINEIFMMHDSVLNEYAKIGKYVSINKYKVKCFPRHIDLKQINSSPSKRVLYLTSAWEFHGFHKEHKFQSDQINDLVNHAENLKDLGYKLAIRKHPRDFSDYNSNETISTYLSKIDSFENDINNSSHVISARSTGLLEASMVDRKVIVFNKWFNETHKNSYIDSLPYINEINELDKFLALNDD